LTPFLYIWFEIFKIMSKLIFNADLMFRIHLEPQEQDQLPFIKEMLRNKLIGEIQSKYLFHTPELGDRILELVDSDRRNHLELIELISQKIKQMTDETKKFREKNFPRKDVLL